MIKNKCILMIIVLLLGSFMCSCGKISQIEEELSTDDVDGSVSEDDISDSEKELLEQTEKGDNLQDVPDYQYRVDSEDALNDSVASDPEKVYSIDEYGTVEEKRQDFFNSETGNMAYYYKMENFFFNDSFPNADVINHTLQLIYDEEEEECIEGSEIHTSGDKSSNAPYLYWHILNIQYVGDDYISILYNDVYYMGGAHPYSRFEGITIDCKTGEQISASQLMEKSDEELLSEISVSMGIDGIGTWEDFDFYLTDSSIVFFYRYPGFWDDVVMQREK